MHSFSEDEKAAFVQHINDALAGDAHLQHILPINADNLDLFSAVCPLFVLSGVFDFPNSPRPTAHLTLMDISNTNVQYVPPSPCRTFYVDQNRKISCG